MDNRIEAKISRDNFNLLFKKIEVVKKKIVTAKFIDYTNCPSSCPFKYNNDKCLNYCKNVSLKDINNDTITSQTIFREEYIEDKTIKKDIKALSKSQIIQYISYYFLPLTAEGKYKNLFEIEISNNLGINIKTVRRNNEVLKALGLINYNKEESGIISIELVNYQKGFKENGSGTINIPLKFFKEIKTMDNIDEIKTALYLFQEHFSKLRGLKKRDCKKTLLIKNIKNIYSYGKQYKKYIITLLEKTSNLFDLSIDVTVLNRRFDYSLKEKYLIFNIKEDFQKDIITTIDNILNAKNMSRYITIKTYDDLISLAFQYGGDLLSKALHILEPPVNNKKFNIGGIIRREIENFLN